jgi:hypothetical protein
MTTKQSDHAGASPGNGERKPYRLVRGHYSRRDGEPVTRRDNESGAPLGGKTRPYVHYQSKTTDNPHARDEVMLTDREAAALGKRVVPLFRSNVRTGEAERFDLEAAGPTKTSGGVPARKRVPPK